VFIDTKTYCNVLSETFAANADLKFSHFEILEQLGVGGKYVGCCQTPSGDIYCINNLSPNVLEYKDGKCSFLGNIQGLKFGYSGGAYYPKDGCVYGFPRNSNKLLKIDPINHTAEEIPLDINYPMPIKSPGVFNHHYGGALVGDYLLCVPRFSRDFLFIDLRDYSIKKHTCASDVHCNGAVLHPNGNVYFTPYANSPVIAYDSNSGKFRRICNKIPINCFNGVTYVDGNVYSIGNGGILKIDTEKDTAEIVLTKTVDGIPITGIYGTKLHFNGKVYGVPGNSIHLFEFDPVENICLSVGQFDDGKFNNAKWAGGSLMPNGDIFLVPAFGRYTAVCKFENSEIKFTDSMKNLLCSPYLNGY
jgi:hypothetical protein